LNKVAVVVDLGVTGVHEHFRNAPNIFVGLDCFEFGRIFLGVDDASE
jgi:hypothetical protein